MGTARRVVGTLKLTLSFLVSMDVGELMKRDNEKESKKAKIRNIVIVSTRVEFLK